MKKLWGLVTICLISVAAIAKIDLIRAWNRNWKMKQTHLICFFCCAILANIAAAGDYALQFNGSGNYVKVADNGSLAGITGNFTIEFWAHPLATHQIDSESSSGIDGTSGQKYAIGPSQGDDRWEPGHAGAGISVGTNGVSVYDHAAFYMPALLVWKGALSSYTHVSVVFENNQPKLYINGALKKVGQRSSKTVHPLPVDIGGMEYGFFSGKLDEIRIWNVARTQAQIQSDMNRKLTGSESNLIGYWAFDEGAGQAANDLTGHGNIGQLGITASADSADPTWITSTAPIEFAASSGASDLTSRVATGKIDLVTLPACESMQVTIYNSRDLTLVRDTRRLTLKKGDNTLQFGWENTLIDPTSISIRPLENADKIDVLFLTYPARVRQIGQWQITSEIEGAVPFEITYFASGLSWRAFYMGTMNEDETTMDLKGYVNVSNNSGQDYTNTQTRLIVGETRLIEEIATLAQRRYPYGPDAPMSREGLELERLNRRQGGVQVTNGAVRLMDDGNLGFGMMGGFGGGGFGGSGMAREKMYEIKEIEKTGLSEYFLYSIEGTEDLTNTWTRRLPSFDIEDVPVKSLYKYDDNRYGNQPVCFVSFANDTEHELGETPIPEGSIKIYRNVNELKNLSYVGQSNIKYIPVNEDVELNLGPARLVKVEPVLIDRKTENYSFDDKGNIDGWDDIETYKVTVTNTRDIPVDIEITWNMGTDSWELTYVDTASRAENAVTYKKHDKSRGRFTLTVAAKTEKTFGHTIRKYRQKRIEAYTEKMKEQEE